MSDAEGDEEDADNNENSKKDDDEEQEEEDGDEGGDKTENADDDQETIFRNKFAAVMIGFDIIKYLQAFIVNKSFKRLLKTI